MKKLVVLTGAGISAESGIQTFRGAGGLWEGHDIMEVASPEGWAKNPQLVLEFYNKRRENIITVSPNSAHTILAELEEYLEVQIVTQNIDDLHERAGSSKVMHLHGEILKARSTRYEDVIYKLEKPRIEWGELCEFGSQLRPHIVWFGEPVPMIEKAIEEVLSADILLVVGTSLEVYPAAGLIHYASNNCPIYVIDPNASLHLPKKVTHIVEPATKGLEVFRDSLFTGSDG